MLFINISEVFYLYFIYAFCYLFVLISYHYICYINTELIKNSQSIKIKTNKLLTQQIKKDADAKIKKEHKNQHIEL